MPGPRYEGWTHLRIEGDRDAANALRPLARKVMGYVQEQAGYLKLPTFKHRMELEGGGYIIGELHGGIPRMTINAGKPKAGKEIRLLEGFFFGRRSGETPEQLPAMLTEPNPDIEDDDWRALFYSSESEGYDLAPEDRRGGYADVFGTKTKKPWYRLESGGGIWVDRDTGEAVTWFRGYLGYWPMHYRHPATNYGQVVSIYGHLVYAAPFEDWRVLAAAKRGNYLYVMIAENLGALSPAERPSVATESGQLWFSQPFTDEAYTYSLWRYALTVETQPDTLIDTYKAVRHEYAEQLWQGTLELAYGAWSFNADCTSVVTMQLPRRCILKLHTYLDEPHHLWATSRDPWPDYPEVEAQRIELTIEHEAEGPPTVSLVQAIAAQAIAEEDGKVLNFVLADVEMDAESPGITNYARMEYQCGEFSAVAYEATRGAAPGGGPNSHLSRNLVYAHLPSMTFLFQRIELGGGAPTESVNIRYELYIGGEEVELDDPYAFDGAVASGSPFSDDVRQRVDTPFYGVLDVTGDFALRIDMDAMTQLYAIRFIVRDRWGALVIDGPHQQAYMFVTKPYIPVTMRLNAPPGSTAEFTGAIPDHGGAGGWSVAEYGGPGPTFAWDDGNENAPRTYFNHGEFLDGAPNLGPIPCPFGYAMEYDNRVVAAVKLDVWMAPSNLEDDPSPYPFVNDFYVLRAATHGDARELIDAIDPRADEAGSIYYTTFPIGHTGKPMKRQQTRFP